MMSFTHIQSLHEFEQTVYTQEQYIKFCDKICEQMINLADKHTNELKNFDGRLSLTLDIPTNTYLDSKPFYTSNAYDFWHYYSTFLKSIRYSKRDHIAELFYK